MPPEVVITYPVPSAKALAEPVILIVPPPIFTDLLPTISTLLSAAIYILSSAVSATLPFSALIFNFVPYKEAIEPFEVCAKPANGSPLLPESSDE